MGDKAEKDALEIVDRVRGVIKYPVDRTLELGIAAALRQRDEEIAQLRAERDAAVDCVEALRDKQNWYRNPDEVCTRARACLARMPQAAERAQAQRDVVAAVRTGAPQAVVQRALERLDALESGGGE